LACQFAEHLTAIPKVHQLAIHTMRGTGLDYWTQFSTYMHVVLISEHSNSMHTLKISRSSS